MEFSRVAILGLGLIGSSLARVVSARNLAGHIAAFDQSQESLDFALEHKFVHSIHLKAVDAVKGADCIIFATPAGSFSFIAEEIAPFIKEGAIITDVASVKQAAIAALKPHLPAHALFVPAHPIAGSEKTGARAGSGDLFAGKQVILTPEVNELKSPHVERISALWQEAGAKVEFMPAFLHDLMYAYISHLPQVVAFSMLPLIDVSLQSDEYRKFARLTQSDPVLWTDICLANANYVYEAMDDFIRFMTQMQGELKESRQDNNNAKANIPVLFAGLVSSCLIATASLLEERIGTNPIRFVGAGFADMTVMVSGDPQEMLAAISDNHSRIIPLLDVMLRRLHVIREAIAAGRGQEIIASFAA